MRCRSGERWLEAELNRHKGQLLRQGHSDASESHSSDHCPGAGGQALGIARRREHRPAPPRLGPLRRSPRPSRADLRLVRRRFRHRRPDRGKGAAGRAGVSLRLHASLSSATRARFETASQAFRHVCFGSDSEVRASQRHVRFPPGSGHPLAPGKCRLWAMRRHPPS
jgi:hypothetical protein